MTRTTLFVRWVLGIGAIAFVLLGLAFMFLPGTMIGAIDINAGSEKAMADIRAVYGGLDLAIGVLLAVFFFRKQWAAGLAVATLTCACLAAGRLVGILVDGANDILTFGLIASEILGGVLSGVAWFLARPLEEAEAAADLAVQAETHAVSSPPEQSA